VGKEIRPNFRANWKGKTMARIAKSLAGIARADFINRIAIAVAQGANAIAIQRMIAANDSTTEFAVAASTRDAYGGRVMGNVLDAMIAEQNGKCLLCSVSFWSKGDTDSPAAFGSIPSLFLLIPSQIWRDVEVSDYAAHESGYLPGNLIAACQLCGCDRDRASEALGKDECITVDVNSLTEGQRNRILLTFPKGVKKSEIDQNSALIAKRRAIRSAQIGF
jgi:hypothetical protein